MTPRLYRSVWLSDLHLGTRGCQTERVLDVLRHTDSDHLNLVGRSAHGCVSVAHWIVFCGM